MRSGERGLVLPVFSRKKKVKLGLALIDLILIFLKKESSLLHKKKACVLPSDDADTHSNPLARAHTWPCPSHPRARC